MESHYYGEAYTYQLYIFDDFYFIFLGVTNSEHHREFWQRDICEHISLG